MLTYAIRSGFLQKQLLIFLFVPKQHSFTTFKPFNMGKKEKKQDIEITSPKINSEEKLDKKFYEKELNRLQIELVKLHEWIKYRKLKVVVIFEGRDAAGKGGTIKRITERLNPRICRVVALGVPSDREKTQWYFQRYVSHLPAAG